MQRTIKIFGKSFGNKVKGNKTITLVEGEELLKNDKKLR